MRTVETLPSPKKWGIKVGEPNLSEWIGLPDKPYPGTVGRWWGAPTTFTDLHEAMGQVRVLNQENPYWNYYLEEYP